MARLAYDTVREMMAAAVDETYECTCARVTVPNRNLLVESSTSGGPSSSTAVLRKKAIRL